MDLTLGVTICSSRDSIMVFQPQFLHGTTLYRPGTERAGIVFTFSTHIRKAYEEAVEKALNGVFMEETVSDNEEEDIIEGDRPEI